MTGFSTFITFKPFILILFLYRYLLYSPLAQDATGKALFDRMIIESSGWDTSASALATSASAQMNQLSSIYTSLACTTGDDTDKLACLRGKSWEDTLDLTAANANVSQVMPVIDIAASVDPLFLRPALTGQPFDLITSGAFNKVRAMRCGGNHLFLLFWFYRQYTY